VLDIPKESTQEEIRRAYRRLALKLHPDKNPGNPDTTQKFQEVNYAHRILSDVTKRTVYDRYGSVGLYLAEQLGEENIGTYYLLTSPWCKALVIFCGVITGCYCCCCCCCCCNFCCGKYKTQVPFYEDEEAGFEELQAELGSDDANEAQPIIAGQPTSGKAGTRTNGSSAAANEEMSLPITNQPSYGYDK